MQRGLGAHQTLSANLLSMLPFQPGYLTRIMEIDEADAEANADDIAELLAN